MSPAPPNRTVAALAYDGLCTFEFGIVAEIFGLDRPEWDDWYRLIVCSEEPGPLWATGGIRVSVDGTLDDLSTAGTVVIPGWRRPREPPPEVLVAALIQAHRRGARILSICSGVFLLAATGLLDGQPATTHWQYVRILRELHPRVLVRPDVLYVDQGALLTSAGSAAGIDLCLHLIRRDHGAQRANAVARRLVVPPHREGGQAQFVERPVADDANHSLSSLMEHVRSTLAEPHSLETMAAAARMSPRSLARHFHRSSGTTPKRWLARERVLRSQSLLESTDWGIDRVARESGFGSAQVLRLHFKRSVGVSPSRYRNRFRAGTREQGLAGGDLAGPGPGPGSADSQPS